MKYKYLVKRYNGFCFSQIFTIQEIENGKALIWLKANQVGEDELHRLRFTGLLDKNGKEIYEGEIRKLKDHTSHYEVKYERGRFYFDCIFADNEMRSILTESEIIGNISDNPELSK